LNVSWFLEPLSGLLVLLRVLSIGTTLVALLDICFHRSLGFVLAGKQPRVVWLAIMVVGLLFSWFGLVAAIVYFTTVRPKLGPAGFGRAPWVSSPDDPYVR
jgi:hypothetical protein